MMGGYGMIAGMGWLGMLVMTLFWIGVALLIVWGIGNLASPRQKNVAVGAEEIVKQRYARGEISREEFLQARETLDEQVR